MSYETGIESPYLNAAVSKVKIKFTPEYFRQQAQSYIAKPVDREAWLNRQVVNLEAAILEYKQALLDIQQRGAALDGKNDIATWMTGIGGIVATIPNPYTIAIGTIVSVAGSIWNGLERKKDTKAARELTKEAQTLFLDAQAIQGYYEKYTREISAMKYTPLLLGAGIVGLLISK